MSKILRFFSAAALFLCAMAVSPQNLYAGEEEEPLLTIGCLSDLHTEYSMISCEDINKVRLRGSIVTALNKMGEREKVDMLLFGGDYTSQVTAYSKAHWEKSRSLLVDLARSVFPDGSQNTPVIYTTGNHEYDASGYGNQVSHYKAYTCWDYYTLPMKDDIGWLSDGDCFYEGCVNPTSTNPNDSIFMLAAFYYQIKGFDFVVLNTGKYFAENNSWYYYSQESVAWVGAKLKELYDEDPDRTVFFVVHVPFKDSNSLSGTDKGQPEDKAKDADGVGSAVRLKQILVQYPNTIMLYGHDHGHNAAMIKEKTSQRVTRYNQLGKVISAFDDTHIDGKVPGGDTPSSDITSGSFYLHNVGNGKYFGNDGANVTMSDTPIKAEVTLIDGGLFKTTFEEKYNLSCGGNGRFSLKERITSTNTQENGYWFCVEDTEATPLVATQVTSLVPGKKYIIVQNYQGDYALGNSIYNSGSGDRIESVGVTISGSSISFANYDAAKNYIYVLESLERPVTSGAFYFHNVGNGKYFGNDGANVTMSDTPIKADVTLIDGGLFKTTFEGKYNLSCGGNGRFSLKDRLTSTNTQENGYWFCVEDTEATPLVATQVTSLVAGKKYIIVQNYQGDYALGNSVYSSGSSARIESVGVTISGSSISFANYDAAKNYIYVIEAAEPETKPDVDPVQEKGGEFYVRNNANGKYLGMNGSNIIGFNDATSKQTLKVSTSKYNAAMLKCVCEARSSNYTLECNSGGLYNFAISTSDVDKNSGNWYCIDDISSETIKAVKASNLEAGKSYLIVYSYSGTYYALSNTSKTNFKKEPRLGSVAVTINDNTIEMAKSDLSDCIYTLEEYVEIPTFFSVFLGSCRYYNNDIDGSWIEQNYEKDPKVIQGLMIYVYSDRIEFHMKNYGEEFGNITKRDDNTTPSGVVIKEDLVPYIVYRKVEKHTGREPQPAPTNINTIPENGNRLFYNVYGMPVSEHYKGIVIDGATGKKYLKE